MAVKIELKRSSVPGKIPTISDIQLGELALNTYDGKVFLKKQQGSTETIVSLAATNDSGSVTSASYADYAAQAGNANTAISSSFATNAISSSFAGNTLSSSYSNYAVTASYALNVTTTSSYALKALLADSALTASSADNFEIRNTLSGSDAYFTGTLTAQTIVAQIVTSSIIYSSGSNILGNNLTDTQALTGSVGVTGSLSVLGDTYTKGNQILSGSVQVTGSFLVSGSTELTGSVSMEGGIAATSFTGSLQGTSSFADFALTASYANNVPATASYAINALSASYAARTEFSITGSENYFAKFSGSGKTLVSDIIYSDGLGVGINTPSFNAAHEALRVNQIDVTSYNVIQAVGNSDNYLQINVKNDSPGPSGSSDIVATAGNGSESENYIDMGINGPNFSIVNNIGGVNDAYLYSTGNELHIGNATADKDVTIFAGGFDEVVNRKVLIDANNQHEITGSLSISGSLTVTDTITAQVLHVQAITASVEYVTGSTVFGSQMTDTHQFTGSVLVTGSVIANDFYGNGSQLSKVGYIEKVFYVSENGSDSNDGKTLSTTFRTIKQATLAASASIAAAPVTASMPFRATIKVQPGYYTEEAPVTVPANTSIIGNDLRTVVVRPTSATTGSNLFLANNADYFFGLRLEGCVIDDLEDPRNGFFFAFAPSASISTSPYIQNCSAIFTPYDKFYAPLDFENGNPLVGNGPGGMIVDDAVLSGYSPLKSMVVDAYTQVAFNGIGICLRGSGYAQLVSFFTNFSRVGVYAMDGGHASLLNSNTTFGDYGLRSSGSRMLVVPEISGISSSIDANGSSLLKTYKSSIQNYMINELVASGSYNTAYISGSGAYYDSTITDSGILIDCLSDDLLSPRASRLSQFTSGLFKAQDMSSGSIFTLPPASGSIFTKGVITVIPQISNISGSLTGDFIKAWTYIRDYIENDPNSQFTAMTSQGKAKVNQSLNTLISTITQVVVNNAGAQFITEFGSLVTSTSHDFSYAGAGVDFLALPENQGGVGIPNVDIRIYEENGGRVFYTAGDETGDFFAGSDFIIRQATGTIEGRTFYKSVSAQITPLNLALETYS